MEVVPDKLNCGVCFKLSEKAARFPCSEQTVCFSCGIRSVLKNKGKCINKECTSEHKLGELKPDQVARKLIAEIKERSSQSKENGANFHFNFPSLNINLNKSSSSASPDQTVPQNSETQNNPQSPSLSQLDVEPTTLVDWEQSVIISPFLEVTSDVEGPQKSYDCPIQSNPINQSESAGASSENTPNLSSIIAIPLKAATTNSQFDVLRPLSVDPSLNISKPVLNTCIEAPLSTSTEEGNVESSTKDYLVDANDTVTTREECSQPSTSLKALSASATSQESEAGSQQSLSLQDLSETEDAIKNSGDLDSNHENNRQRSVFGSYLDSLRSPPIPKQPVYSASKPSPDKRSTRGIERSSSSNTSSSSAGLKPSTSTSGAGSLASRNLTIQIDTDDSEEGISIYDSEKDQSEKNRKDNSFEAEIEKDWCRPGIEVVVKDSYSVPSMRGQHGVVNATCLQFGTQSGLFRVFLREEKRIVSISPRDLDPVIPSRRKLDEANSECVEVIEIVDSSDNEVEEICHVTGPEKGDAAVTEKENYAGTQEGTVAEKETPKNPILKEGEVADVDVGQAAISNKGTVAMLEDGEVITSDEDFISDGIEDISDTEDTHESQNKSGKSTTPSEMKAVRMDKLKKLADEKLRKLTKKKQNKIAETQSESSPGVPAIQGFDLRDDSTKNSEMGKDGDQTQTQALDQAREKLKKLLDFIKALRSGVYQNFEARQNFQNTSASLKNKLSLAQYQAPDLCAEDSLLEFNNKITKAEKVKTDTLLWIHSNFKRNTPEPSKRTWQAEDTVFTLRSAYNYEIDLSERDFQEKVTIGVTVSDSSVLYQLEAIPSQHNEEIMCVLKASEENKLLYRKTFQNLLQANLGSFTKQQALFATFQCNLKENNPSNKIVIDKGSVVGFAKKAEMPPPKQNDIRREPFPIHLMRASKNKAEEVGEEETKEIIGYVDFPRKIVGYHPLVYVRLADGLDSRARLVHHVATVQDRGRLFLKIVPKSGLGSLVLDMKIIGTAEVLNSPSVEPKYPKSRMFDRQVVDVDGDRVVVDVDLDRVVVDVDLDEPFPNPQPPLKKRKGQDLDDPRSESKKLRTEPSSGAKSTSSVEKKKGERSRKPSGTLFLECEILRDGKYAQFTQLGSILDLEGSTSAFQAHIQVKHMNLYEHYKPSQDLSTLLNQDGMAPVTETEAITQFYAALNLNLSFNKDQQSLIILTNSASTVELLKGKSTKEQFSVFSGVIHLREFLKASGLGNQMSIDLNDEVETEDVYRAVLKKGWRKKGDRNPNCSDIAKFTRDIIRHDNLVVSCKRPIGDIKADQFLPREDDDKTLKEVEIAYSYSPSAPVLVQLKYYIDFIDVDDDDDGGGSVPKPTVKSEPTSAPSNPLSRVTEVLRKVAKRKRKKEKASRWEKLNINYGLSPPPTASTSAESEFSRETSSTNNEFQNLLKQAVSQDPATSSLRFSVPVTHDKGTGKFFMVRSSQNMEVGPGSYSTIIAEIQAPDSELINLPGNTVVFYPKIGTETVKFLKTKTAGYNNISEENVPYYEDQICNGRFLIFILKGVKPVKLVHGQIIGTCRVILGYQPPEATSLHRPPLQIGPEGLWTRGPNQFLDHVHLIGIGARFGSAVRLHLATPGLTFADIGGQASADGIVLLSAHLGFRFRLHDATEASIILPPRFYPHGTNVGFVEFLSKEEYVRGQLDMQVAAPCFSSIPDSSSAENPPPSSSGYQEPLIPPLMSGYQGPLINSGYQGTHIPPSSSGYQGPLVSSGYQEPHITP